MPDSVVQFFEELGKRGHEPLFEGVSGTLRFDLASGEDGTRPVEFARGRESAPAEQIDHWFVEIRDGDIRVSRDAVPADCVVHTNRTVFRGFLTGRTNAQAAWLRGLMWAEGNIVMHRLFDRIFPGPPGAHDPRDFARRGRQR